MPIWAGSIQIKKIGRIGAAVTENGLIHTRIYWSRSGNYEEEMAVHFQDEILPPNSLVQRVLGQIQEYIKGERSQFTVPVDWEGADMTAFQRKVLQATLSIPYGETRSYGEIASEIGNPRAARAVGQAEAHNPMPLVIPCHRVIGSDGAMVGYGGPQGVGFKRRLLHMEKENRVRLALGR